MCEPHRAACETEDGLTLSGYTIAACNVGALEAGTGTSSYGYHFQRGNNFGFDAYPGTTVDTTGLEDLVDASGYGPTTATGYTASGYYERDLFIRTDNALTNYDWSSVQNDNLWGNNGTEEDRQGPCATGWHVPTNAEWLGLMRAVCYAGIFSGNGNCAASSWTTNFTTADRDAIVNYLNLPLAGNRNRSSGALALQGSHARYWASTPNGTYAYYLSMLASNLYPQHYNNRAYGFSVRCFKNSTP